MNKKSRYKQIIIIEILFIILFFTGLYFLYHEIKSKNESIYFLQEEIQSIDDKKAYINSVKKQIKDLSDDIKRVENSTIPFSGDVQFIEGLENLAESYNLDVQIESLNLSNEIKSGTDLLSILKVKAKVEGVWSNIYAFIYELESMPVKIKVNKISLSSSDVISLEDRTASGKWNAVFEIGALKETK